MPDNAERGRYVPIRRESDGTERSHRLPFDIFSLSVTGLVIICELDDPAPGNSRPTMSMKMTQYLCLSDESMIRLDRGVSSFRHGHSEIVSWERSAADVIAEVTKCYRSMDSPTLSSSAERMASKQSSSSSEKPRSIGSESGGVRYAWKPLNPFGPMMARPIDRSSPTRWTKIAPSGTE